MKEYIDIKAKAMFSICTYSPPLVPRGGELGADRGNIHPSQTQFYKN